MTNGPRNVWWLAVVAALMCRFTKPTHDTHTCMHARTRAHELAIVGKPRKPLKHVVPFMHLLRSCRYGCYFAVSRAALLPLAYDEDDWPLMSWCREVVKEIPDPTLVYLGLLFEGRRWVNEHLNGLIPNRDHVSATNSSLPTSIGPTYS